MELGKFSSNLNKSDVGYYFNESSKVAAFYIDGTGGFKSVYGLEVRSYLDFTSTTGIDLGATWTHTDYDNGLNVNANLYVTNAWSVGVEYTDSKYVDFFADSVPYLYISENMFIVKSAYWLRISDMFSATFEISKVLDSDIDGLLATIGVTGRF
ncbi:hypothetical protein WNY81_20550 [Shewanella frigidimarina]|uniref:hypothetical protein n=1 Tax=Shewanella frigidimarina TaxID=56812 RepID=UPI003182678F